MTSTLVANNTTQGWVSQNGGRGTLDIIWTCIFTIFLCCWTSVCVNIPAATETRWQRFLDKLKVALLGILGPEFLLMLAIGQYESAKESVRRFRAAGYDKWTLQHAFFANMGGFLLKTPGEQPQPLNGELLLSLIQKDYVQYPDYDTDSIDDKNKSDSLARLITVLQALIFTVSSISRLASHLAITTLEVTTLAFIFIMLATSYFWWHKPQSVTRGVTLKSEYTLSEILREVGDSSQDFALLRRNDWLVSVLWQYFTYLLKRSGRILSMPLRKKAHALLLQPQKNRIASDYFPNHSLTAQAYCGLIMIAYSSIFLCAWNFYFPTTMEKVFWRVASVLTVGYMFPGGLGLMCIEYAYFGRSKYSRREKGWTEKCFDYVWKVMRLPAARPTASTVDTENDVGGQPWRLYLPWPALAYSTAICAIYCFARAYILIEDIVGLRRLPSSVFETVSWTEYLPQI